MKLVLVMVSSLDGITNQGNAEDQHVWTSEEDKTHFREVLDASPLVIMGAKTYEAARPYMVHRDGRIRIVMTTRPEDYEKEKIPGKLEFTNEEVTALIKRLEASGISEGIHVGGATTNTPFFKAGLITEVWQTIEPKILGEGYRNMATQKLDINLELITSEKLNARGTLLLKYRVI